MARKNRILCESGIYHIILRGNNRQQIFHDDYDRMMFLGRMKKYAVLLGIELHTYCLMDNHVHILVGNANCSMSLFVQRLATSYAMYFNRKYERSGHLFQGRFRSETVEDECRYRTVFRYILQNPMKAGMCSGCRYRWNSYEETVEGRNLYASSHFISHDEMIAFLDCRNDDRCMEYENRFFISDMHGMRILKKFFGNRTDRLMLNRSDDELKLMFRKLKESGMSVNQISRLTGIPWRLIRSA